VVALWTALLASAFAGAAAAQGAPHGEHQVKLHEDVVFPAGRDTVSVRFEDVGGHVQIPVSVNGSPPLMMVFDTGMPTPGVLLYAGERVDRMKLPFGDAKIRVGGAGGAGVEQEARLAQGITLRVGALEIGSTIAIVMPAKPEMSSIHDGIIGASLFRNMSITIDHDQNIVRFTRAGQFVPPTGASAVPLEIIGNHAYVQAALVDAAGATTPLRLIVDLGATHAVSLNSHANPAIHVPAGARTTRVGRGMSGVLTGRVGRIAGFELGGRRLQNVVATFPDSAFENPRALDSRDGNLGSGILSRFEVTFDYAGGNMYLLANRRFAEPFEWDMSGLTFDPGRNGALVVAEVLPDSPASRAGITPGEQLISVDGEAAEARELMRKRDRFKQAGREIVLRLRKGGAERNVKLKLERLV
jgi:hypothetical protein